MRFTRRKLLIGASALALSKGVEANPNGRAILLGIAGGPLSYEQLVAGNARTPNGTFTADANTTRTENIRICTIGGQDAAYVKPIYVNYYVDNSNIETNVGNACVLEVSMYVPSAPTPGPVRGLFSGANSGTMPDGSSGFSPSPFLPSDFGYTNGRFPAGMVFYIIDSRLVAVGEKVAIITSSTYNWAVISAAFVENMVRNNNASSQVMTPGLRVGTALHDQSPLAAIVGKFYRPEVSLIFWGDSIPSGSNEGPGSGYLGAAAGAGGPWVRAAWNVNGRAIPHANFGRGGSSPISNPNTVYAKRFLLMKYGTHACVMWGTNAIFNNANTPATVFANLTACTAALAATGIRNQIVHPLMPRTTGAWTATDGSDQTPATGFAAAGYRDQLNALIAASVGSNGVTRVFDFNPTVQLATDANKWNATGVAAAWTNDGLHFTSSHTLQGNINSAAALAIDYAAYLPDRSGA